MLIPEIGILVRNQITIPAGSATTTARVNTCNVLSKIDLTITSPIFGFLYGGSSKIKADCSPFKIVFERIFEINIVTIIPIKITQQKIITPTNAEFERDKNAVSKKFYNQYLEVVGEISKIDEEKKLVEIEYDDADGKYSLLVKGHLTDEVIMSAYNAGEKVHVLGTAKVFKAKTETEPNTIELEGCFIKGIIE